jgi:hypothetical protein
MTTIVIASCREASMKRWLEAWRSQLGGCRVILVEDSPSKSFELDTSGYDQFEHYAWDDIDRDLGGDSWIIPRRSSAVKSYGFLRAKGEVTWTLDDDCFPEPRWQEYPYQFECMLTYKYSEQEWVNTLPPESGLFPRGYPYEIRKFKPVRVIHGLWSNIPDLDGVTALDHPAFRTGPAADVSIIPHGKLFPMCGMNLAFAPEVLPAMYFMLQGHERTSQGLKKLPFDRFDDIWAGLFVKRIADQMGWLVTSGYPSIVHTKESDPQERVIKEAPGIEVHEKFWRHVASADISSYDDAGTCYLALANSVEDFAQEDHGHKYYWYKLARAMRTWTELTSD